MALYNVTPEKVGKYFHKTACFCFNQQTLAANQSMEFPVSFWVDPAIRDDPNTADVKVITLSYTFFRSLDDAAEVRRAGQGRAARRTMSAADAEARRSQTDRRLPAAPLNWAGIWRLCGSRVGAVSPAVLLWIWHEQRRARCNGPARS